LRAENDDCTVRQTTSLVALSSCSINCTALRHLPCRSNADHGIGKDMRRMRSK
jgi:hypothetical protein